MNVLVCVMGAINVCIYFVFDFWSYDNKCTERHAALATCALAVGVQKSKHRNVCINIIWICINFALHDMFYCAVFNLCNLFIMHVGLKSS